MPKTNTPIRNLLSVKVRLPIREGRISDTRQTTVFHRTLFVLFYCLAITQKPVKTFVHLFALNFCRGAACHVSPSVNTP